jgi:phosphatidylethanolamine/phosphatidyl-N-methylethanolamine N-methyltransferase
VSNETKNTSAITPTGTISPAATPYVGRAARVAEATRFGDCLAFMRGFLSRPLEVASVVPSSAFLEARVVEAAGLAQARCIVELGPGTGGTTRALLRAMAPQAWLLAIELNPGFSCRLRRHIADARLAVQAGSAEGLIEHLRSWGLPPADVVISGIPFSTLPAGAAQRIASAVDASLAPGGRVVAYQLRPHVARYITPHLGAPKAAWELRNLPPMRVFRWVKPAAR